MNVKGTSNRISGERQRSQGGQETQPSKEGVRRLRGEVQTFKKFIFKVVVLYTRR